MNSSVPFSIGNFVDWMASMPFWVVWLLLAIALMMLLFVIFSIPKLRRLLPALPLVHREKEDEDTAMVRACRQFHAILRSMFPGSRSQYRLPLYIAIGPSAAATRACIRDSGLAMPLGEPLSSGGLTWSAFDRGSVVEVSPSVYSQSSRWRGFIRLLQRFRPHRPFDGIILVIPSSEIGPEAVNFDKSLGEAEQIRKALAELSNKIVMSVPIYCVIAQCEDISGFSSLGSVIDHNNIYKPLGFTSPHGETHVYHPEIVDEALTSIVDRIQDLVMHALTIGPKDLDKDSLFCLPGSFKNLLPKLQSYLTVLMEPGHFSQLSSLRGIYVNGILNTGEFKSSGISAFAKGALQEKIFPEFSIATPTVSYWSSVNRNVRKAQIIVIVLFLLGTAGLLAKVNYLNNKVPRLSEAVSAISRDFRRVSTAQASPGALQEVFSQHAGPIIQRLTGLDSGYLESPVMPNSYFGGLRADLDALRTAAFIEILTRNIGKSLKLKAIEVTRESSGTRHLMLAGVTGRPYPHYQLLNNSIEKYSELTTQINYFNRLQSGKKDSEALTKLTKYLFGVQLPSNYFPDIDFNYLGSQEIVIGEINSAAFKRAAQSTLLSEGEKFFSDLENPDRFLNNLREIAFNLEGNRVSFNSSDSAQSTIQNLFNNLLFLQSELKLGKYDWIFDDTALISKTFQDTLFKIKASPLLGSKVSNTLKTEAISVRQRLRKDILDVRVSSLGTLTQIIDGKLRLSPSVNDIINELENSGKAVRLGNQRPVFIKENWTQYDQRRLPTPLSENLYIKWDISELRTGSKRLSKLLKSKSMSTATPGLISAFKTIDSSERVNLILQTLDRAFVQKEYKSSLVSGPSSGALTEWAENYRNSLGFLESFIFALVEPDTSQIKSDLIDLVMGEGEKIISHAKSDFNSKEFYSIDKTALENWKGTTGLAGRLFGGIDNVTLLANLDQQRILINSIAYSQVKQPLRFILKYSEKIQSSVIKDVIFWRLILEDLVAYENKIPNNNILKLEQFLVSRLQSLSVGNCRLESDSGRSEGASFFSQKLQKISFDTVGGCERIEKSKIQISYRKFASYFNNKFSGRVPFSISPNSNVADANVDPRSLIHLFSKFDNNMNQGMGDPFLWAPGEKTKKIIGFLNQLDDAVSTLRPGIIGDLDKAKMVYDVTPSFRVLRDQEIGADQIIDWSMTVGDKTVRFTDQKKILDWETGKLIKFKFRWAKNSTEIPISDDKDNNQFSSGQELTFVFNGPWSLFSVIHKYGKLNTDGSAYNLRFEVPVASKAVGEKTIPVGTKTVPKAYRKATIFVALKLTINGQIVNLPSFPKRAPVANF